ncbi:MAG: hypothetical protein NWE96_03255 [Candidatus Bathyarchaeota archaeon]|nr:hypothetical protein [Candidatus Bathyarchaeota archaeon]
MAKRSFKSNCRGQVLVVTALLVALLLLSTAIYVIEVGKNVPEAQQVEGTSFAVYKTSFRSALISALANVTGGGDRNVLSTDLSALKATILAHSYKAMLTIEYSTQNNAPYSDGFWISWGTNGKGVSSVSSSFDLSASGLSGSSELQFALNVTSALEYSGTYIRLADNAKQVTLTIKVLNEGTPALAQNFTVYIDHDGTTSTVDWVEITSPNVVDFGNGTYRVSFVEDTAERTSPVIVSLLCQDKRGILIGAEATCTLTG